MTKRASHRADVNMIIAINRILSEKLEKQSDGYYKYHVNWDDARVAKEVGNGCIVPNVAYVRKEQFGLIAEARKAPKQILEQVAELEAKVTNIIAACEENFKILFDAIDALKLEMKGHSTAIENLENADKDLTTWARQRGFGTPNGRMHQ